MTTRRVVIGKRFNGDYGIFVSKPGFDAYNAADADLSLNISSKVSALLLLAHVSSTQTISLGLSRSPIALVTSLNALSSYLPGAPVTSGPTRPSPMFALQSDGNGGFVITASPSAAAVINGNGASITISCSGPANVAVYTVPFT
jgi:hypothetical protein